MAYLGATAVLTALFAVQQFQPVPSVSRYVVLLSVVPAMGVGIHRNRPVPATPWHWLLASAPLVVAAAIPRSLIEAADGPSVMALALESIPLLGYGTAICALTLMLRVRSGDRAVGIEWEILVIGLGAWVLAWALLIHPTLDLNARPAADVVLRGLREPLGMIILLLDIRLGATNSVRTPSYCLLSLGLLLTVAGDLGHALVGSGGLNADPTGFDALYVLACSLVGAAALHPSMRMLTEHRAGGPRPLRASHAALVVGATFVPVLVIGFIQQEPDSRLVTTWSSFVLIVVATIAVLRAELHNAKAEALALAAARQDPLTGLPNRALMAQLITDALHEAWSTNTLVAVFFVDLDRFKSINDSLGHVAGNELLRIVARRFRSVLPPGSYVGRMSGDEFVLVGSGLRAAADAVDLADQLLACFSEPIALTQGDMFVTASIGLAVCAPYERTDAEMLLRDADTAMYRAKDSGRNSVALFDPTMLERVASRLRTETALRWALDRGELQLHHQPIVDVERGTVTGFEALVRWERPGHVPVLPAEFIPVAEDTGLIVPIGTWVINEALTQLRAWISQGLCPPEMTMSVNISPRQLLDDHLVAVISAALARTKLAPSTIWLEVTEGVMMSDPTRALAVLESLDELGVNIAIDDFGTGYASLSLLKRYPVRRIKIDRSFVADLGADAGDRSLVSTIIAMAHALGHDVVAEGVETERQLWILRELRCDRAQGFLFSAPLPAEAVASGLERLRSSSANGWDPRWAARTPAFPAAASVR